MSRSISVPSPAHRKALNQIHRSAGITAGGVLLYLLFTGIPLQFTDELALGQRHVSAPAILDWYGLQAPVEVIGNGDVAYIGGQLYWHEQRLGSIDGGLEFNGYLGSTRHATRIIGASARRLWRFPVAQPADFESIPLPGRASAIGTSEGRIYLLVDNEFKRVDAEFLNIEAVSATAVDWLRPVTLPPAAAQRYRERYRHYLLTAERLLQDLHSGRLFGQIGIWTVNVSTVLLIVLSITGLWIWWRSRQV